MDSAYLRAKIREIEGFPTPGVSFKDITPLLEDKKAFKHVIDGLVLAFQNKGIEKVVGIDARGFLLAPPVAYLLGAGVVIVRKKGKLPHKTIAREHELEYGKGLLEMHIDAVKPKEKILIIDDVLATGGTAEAAAHLVEHLGGSVVGIGFLLELPLGGRERLKRHTLHSLIKY